MFENILNLIKEYDTIVIHRHSSPDGDALGSQIGLKHIILDNFPGKTVYAVGDKAGRYAFMEDSAMDEIADDVYSGALAIVLDVSAPALISDSRYTTAKATARIDHHLFIDTICQEEVVDTTFESCCGLIAQLAMEAGLKLSPISARSLYTGMVTDSGRFRYDSVGARTHHLASFLMEQPFDTNEIYRNLYANDFAQVLLRAQFVLKIRFTEHNAAYIYTTKEELQATGADTFSVSRGMVNVMADIRGVDIWVNFTETDSGVICEIRSGTKNVCPVARKYGGGGHEKACGATVPDRETAMALLADLDRMAGE